MTKNYHGQLGIPRSRNDWGVMLLAAIAPTCGVVLIFGDKASVAEASVYTAPAWALIGVQKGRRAIESG